MTIFEFVIVVMADTIVIITLIIMSFNPKRSKKSLDSMEKMANFLCFFKLMRFHFISCFFFVVCDHHTIVLRSICNVMTFLCVYESGTFCPPTMPLTVPA